MWLGELVKYTYSKTGSGIARMNKKVYAHQRETTGSSSDSLQLHPFFEMGASLKGKNLLPEGVNSFL